MIGVIGISHRTADLAQRERFAVTAAELPPLLTRLKERFGPVVVLSTCNRTELYLSHPQAGINGCTSTPERLREALTCIGAEQGGEQLPDECLYLYEGREAARHLLRVAAALDSLVLGEEQILGQVRTAFTVAADAGTSDRLLSRLFHLAIATGRRVRNETAIGRYTRSVGTAAVAAAARQVPDLGNATAVVIGAGEAGRLAAQGLAELGIGRLLLANRTLERASSLAASLGAGAAAVALGEADGADLADSIAGADVVISASAAAGYRLLAQPLREARAGSTRPLLLIDIAVPRDIDPAVAQEPGVSLLDIDDLLFAEDEAGEQTNAVLMAAETIVDEEVERLAGWWETLCVVPTITALRSRAESVRRAEVERSLGRMPNLTAEERSRIEALSGAIVNKLLHTPIMRLKQDAASEQFAALVRDLFDLEGTPDLLAAMTDAGVIDEDEAGDAAAVRW